MQHSKSAAKRGITTALVVSVLLLGAPAAHAAPTVVINEVDAAYPGDAPDTVGDSQSAPVLEPGDYGTTLVSQNEREVVYQGPLFVDLRDVDVYKITVLPGVLAKFTVTPHNGQDIFVRMYDSDGREVADHHYNAGNRRAAGFAETVMYLRGLHLSREEDGEITVYVLVQLNGGNKSGRYSINYEESNANDATWTTDAADSLLRAPRVGWGQRYEGYLGYGDKKDCFQLDAAAAVGRKVTIRVAPLDPELNTELKPGWSNSSYANANGQALGLLSTSPVRIGAREYGRDEIVKARNDGGAGFPDDQVVYPYYAKAGDSGSDFAYVCVGLDQTNRGAGRYEFTLAHEDAPLAAAAPTDTDKSGVTLPPGAPVAPAPPPIRMKKASATPLIIDIPTPGAGTGKSALRSIRIGDPVPQEQRDTAKEKKAAETFKKIYRRAPDTSKTADRTAVDTIAYQLKEKKKDIRAEKVAIAKFRVTFKRVPKGESDWAIVRAIAYSKVKR